MKPCDGFREAKGRSSTKSSVGSRDEPVLFGSSAMASQSFEELTEARALGFWALLCERGPFETRRPDKCIINVEVRGGTWPLTSRSSRR